MLGVGPQDVNAPALLVNAGSEQLIVPLRSVSAVQRCVPSTELLRRHASVNARTFLVYVWSQDELDRIEARFFFAKGSEVSEDPATGSACANLGGWFIATQSPLPLRKQIHQGAAIGRSSLLGLHVNTAQQIFVSGRVLELGHGVIEL
jgi:trans-2,3-dihydro-3-hydroxyanthranilate isomerase